ESLQIDRSGEHGYVLTDAGTETLYIAQFSLARPEEVEKIHAIEKWDIEGLTCAPNDSKIAYTVNEGGISKLVVFDTDTNSHEEVDGLPKGVIQSISWMSDDAFICTVKSPTMPGDCWKY